MYGKQFSIESTRDTCEEIPGADTHQQTTSVLLSNGAVTESNTKVAPVPVVFPFPVDRCSSYRKLLRVTAYVLRFVYNIRKSRDDRIMGNLKIQELKNAEKCLIRCCQREAFSNEIESIKSKTKHTTLVKQLRLFQDSDDMLRCSGRLQNANITDDAKYPLLLPKNSALTKLIVEDAHALQLHSGVNSTVTFIRQKYWIPSIRQCVNSVIRKCVTCRKVNGKPYRAPDPPPLPRSRV